MGRKTLVGSAQNFALGDIQDVITDANLGDDRLSHFCMARGQILSFSIGLLRVMYALIYTACNNSKLGVYVVIAQD